LLAPISSYSNLLTILALPNYLKLLHSQTYVTRRSVAAAVCHSILNNDTIISTPEDVEGVLSLIRVLIKEGTQTPSLPATNSRPTETEETIEEQGWLARMVHLFTNKDSAETDFEILKIVKDAYKEAPGDRCKYTTGSLVTAGIKLVRRFKAREHLVPFPSFITNNRTMIGRIKFLRRSSLFTRPSHNYSEQSPLVRKWHCDNTCLQRKSQIQSTFLIRLTISLNRRFPSMKTKSQTRNLNIRLLWVLPTPYNPRGL